MIGQWEGLTGFTKSQATVVPTSDSGQVCPSYVLGTTYFQVTPAQAYAGVTTNVDAPEMTRNMWERHNTQANHKGGANYTFGDGHAKFEMLEQTLSSTNFQWGEYYYPQPAPAFTPDGSKWNTSCN